MIVSSNYYLLNTYRCGRWLDKAYYKYKNEQKCNTILPLTWDKWIEANFNISIPSTYDYHTFAERFHNYQEIFKTGQTFYFFGVDKEDA